ncbi:MAG: hypothetical protein NC033_06575 [Clostridiales bacterium]|nr:hypothetical protein [Clostridiales bacterium]
MKKPRVLFPYVEAGMGHIVPMRAIAAKFKEMYGDRVECVECKFFGDSGDKTLVAFEKKMCKSVVDTNRDHALGFFMTASMLLFGAKIATPASSCCLKAGTKKPAVKHMEELAPDMVVSTHWATNYFAKQSPCAPQTVLYCPDAYTYPLFNYDSDLLLLPAKAGYEHALKRWKRRFNTDNLKCVPALIRDEAYEVTADKLKLREGLGLASDKFTVVLAEGGYGIGKLKKICREVIKRDLNVNLIAVCGKNEELYNQMKGWETGKNCAFHPVGFTDKMLEYMACADLFCGKSGANVFFEACFFGVPQIVTNTATHIEKFNCRYFVNDIKTALKIFNAKKVADKIEEFAADPEKLSPYKKAAVAQRENYGAEKTARLIYDLLCTRFPELKE